MINFRFTCPFLVTTKNSRLYNNFQKHERVNGIMKTDPKEIRRGKREAKKSQEKYKAENKGVEIIQNISLITVNINGQS